MGPGPDPAGFAAERARLLGFATGARHPLGYGWLRDDGTLDDGRPVHLWITARMTHVAALGALADEPGGPSVDTLLHLARHGTRALSGPLHDDRHGGWFAAVDVDGVVDGTKQAYGHSFVVLAAASASHVGIEDARGLLDDALSVVLDRFWDEDAGLVVDEWDRRWATLDPYRGINANMHTVEAFLAAGAATGESAWYERALRITTRVVGWARAHGWRIPEHFTPSWEPLLDHNRERPDDQFRPFGATIGHGLEWARLLLAVDTALGRRPPTGLLTPAIALYDRAVTDGWAADGHDGFVYTTDWDGVPVVRHRMHWVAAEALMAATALRSATGEQRFADDAVRWWRFVERHHVDAARGSWHHELDPSNEPSSTVWSGKPDVYHAYQAMLFPTLPNAPSLAAALVDGPGS